MDFLANFLDSPDTATGVMFSKIAKFERDITRYLMDVVSAAKDCSPYLYDFTDQQEQIVLHCRDAAKSTYQLADATKAFVLTPNPSAMLKAVADLETTASSLVKVVASSNVVLLEPSLVQSLQESHSGLTSQIAMFKTYLSKLKIDTSLSQMSELASVSKLTAAELIDMELSREPDLVIKDPTDPGRARDDLLKCPAWILNKLRKEHRQNKEYAAKIQKLKTKIHNEREAHRQWKEEVSEFMDEKYTKKEQVLKEREKSLEDTIRRMTLGGDTMAPLLAELANTSPTSSPTSTSKNPPFTQSSTNNTLLTSSGSGGSAKQTSPTPFKSTDAPRDRSTPILASSRNPKGGSFVVQSTVNPGPPPAKNAPVSGSFLGLSTAANNSTPPAVKKTVKVFLDGENQPHSFDFVNHQLGVINLSNLLDLVCAKKGWSLGQAREYGFQPNDSPRSTLFLKLETKIQDISNDLKLIRRIELSPTNSLSGSTSANSNKIPPPAADVCTIAAKNGFEIEMGDPKCLRLEDISTKRLVDSDKNTPYYRHYYHQKPHTSYWADGGPKLGPVVVSVEIPSSSKNQGMDKDIINTNKEVNAKFRALVRTKYDDEWVFVDAGGGGGFLRGGSSKKEKLLKALETQCKNGNKMKDLKLHEITRADGETLLLEMENKLLVKGYKFGILYCRAGQKNEDEMFGNVVLSREYEEFLEFLGEKITLQGWTKYRGGLDVKTNTTGTHSVYATHCGYEIMFHVSTMLPHNAKDVQQLERKRHLGNDVCVVVFKDTPEPFAPDTIKSEFNHVFIVVTPEKSNDGVSRFRVNIAYKDGVGMSSPPLPHPPVFEKTPKFRDYLFTKLINAERHAMYAPGFVTKLAKTKELQMMDVIDIIKKGD